MTQDEFSTEYYSIAERAITFSEKSRREGFLAMEEELNVEKADNRDIFEYGIRLVVDGWDSVIIEKILSNIIQQEKDEDLRRLKAMQKEAVLLVQVGVNTRVLCLALNSYAKLTLKEDKSMKDLEYF